MDEIVTATTLSTALPNAWIERLFVRLASIYGNKFADMWAGQDVVGVRQMWANELSGFSADEIRGGLDRMRFKHPSWPPSLFDFMELCRPSVKVESVNHEAAFYEAVRATEKRKQGDMGAWSTKAAYWASIDVSAFDLLNLTWPQIKGRWTKALNERLADPNLPEIPEPPKRLVAPEVPLDRNVERLHEMLASLTGKKKNDRAWVGKILERKARGDSTLSDIAYQMALNSENVR